MVIGYSSSHRKLLAHTATVLFGITLLSWEAPRQMASLFSTGNFLKDPSALPQEASTVCALRFFEALVSKSFPCCVPLHLSPVAQVWGRTLAKAGRDLVPLVLPALLALLGGPLGKWGRGKKQSPVLVHLLYSRGTAVPVWPKLQRPREGLVRGQRHWPRALEPDSVGMESQSQPSVAAVWP